MTEEKALMILDVVIMCVWSICMAVVIYLIVDVRVDVKNLLNDQHFILIELGDTRERVKDIQSDGANCHG